MARTNFGYACGGYGSTRVTERVWAVPGPFSLSFDGKREARVGTCNGNMIAHLTAES